MILTTSKNTKKLTYKEKRKIFILKNEFWEKGIKSQKKWFTENIKQSDIHNLLFIKNTLIGYTCLRLRTLKKNKKYFKYFYFDTLIISKKFRNKGLGSLLTSFNNKVIETKNIPSFLVCVKKRVKFYKKNNWMTLIRKNYQIMDEDYGSKIGMIYNSKLRSKLYFWIKK